MTYSEMKYEFDLLYDAMYSGTSPGFSVKAKSLFLTQAQEELVLEQLNYSYSLEKKYDEDALRKIGLGSLIVTQPLLSVSYPGVTYYENLGKYFRNKDFISGIVEMPNDYMQSIIEMGIAYLKSNTPPTDTQTFNVRVVDKIQSNVLVNLDNPFKNPTKDLVWKIQYEVSNGVKKIELIHSTAIVLQTLYLKYIKYPTPIIVGTITKGSIDGYTTPMDSIVDKVLHREIIRRAVTKARASLNDAQGYQISKNEEV